MEAFEQALAAQPLRRPDPALRAAVLDGCREVASRGGVEPVGNGADAASRRSWWRLLAAELFTPCRPLYGSLAAVWAFIVVINWLAVRPGPVERSVVARQASQATQTALAPAAIEALRQQREILIELTRVEGPSMQAAEADRLPPRSAIEVPTRCVWRRWPDGYSAELA